MKRLARAAALFSLTFAAVAQPGCTLLGDFGTQQCTVAADCAALGEGLFHCESNVCVPIGPGGAACSNRQCTADLGVPSVCNPDTQACSRLLVGGGACKLTHGPLVDDLVILSVWAPLVGPEKKPVSPVVQLALDEINSIGLPFPGNPDRRASVLALVCDQTEEEVAITTELLRLRDEVGVDAYITEMSASQIAGYKGPSQPWADEMVLATRADEDKLVQEAFDDRNLLWHAVGDVQELERLYAKAIDEAIARQQLAPIDARIAFIANTDEGGYLALAENVVALLEEEHPGTVVEVYTLADGSGTAAQDGVDNIIANTLPGQRPDVIVDFAGETFANNLVLIIEGDRGNADAFGDPVYVGSPRARYGEPLFLYAQMLGYSDRFVGIEFYTDADPVPNRYESFAQRLASSTANIEPWGYNVLYDALYMMTYAVVAAGIMNAAPDAIADGIKRIDGGSESIAVGKSEEDSLERGIQLLQLDANETFQFEGTTGPLSFDQNTGARDAPQLSTYCIVVEEAAGRYEFGRRTFDVETGEFVGSGEACF